MLRSKEQTKGGCAIKALRGAAPSRCMAGHCGPPKYTKHGASSRIAAAAQGPGCCHDASRAAPVGTVVSSHRSFVDDLGHRDRFLLHQVGANIPPIGPSAPSSRSVFAEALAVKFRELYGVLIAEHDRVLEKCEQLLEQEIESMREHSADRASYPTSTPLLFQAKLRESGLSAAPGDRRPEQREAAVQTVGILGGLQTDAAAIAADLFHAVAQAQQQMPRSSGLTPLALPANLVTGSGESLVSKPNASLSADTRFPDGDPTMQAQSAPQLMAPLSVAEPVADYLERPMSNFTHITAQRRASATVAKLDGLTVGGSHSSIGQPENARTSSARPTHAGRALLGKFSTKGDGIDGSSPVGPRANPDRVREKLLSMMRFSDPLADIANKRKSRKSRFNSGPADTTKASVKVDTVMGMVIMLNTILMGVSTDFGEGSPAWVAVDAVFATFYTLELWFKIRTQGFHGFFRGDGMLWNSFDTFVGFFAVTEVIMAVTDALLSDGGASKSKFQMFRVVRLCRITRLARLIRIPLFKDLLMMISGIVGGMRTLFWSMILILIPLYAVALILRDTVGRLSLEASDPAYNFSSLALSMFTIFRCVVSGDCTNMNGEPIIFLITEKYGWWYGVMYCILMLLMTFGLFNVIVALYVENTVAAAKHNDVLQLRQRLTDNKRLSLKARKLVNQLWDIQKDGDARRTDEIPLEEMLDMEISESFMAVALRDPDVQLTLDELDISKDDRIDMFDILDTDGSGSLTMDELLLGIVRLRGEPRRSDIVYVGLVIRVMFDSLSKFQEDFGRELQWQSQVLEQLIRKSPLHS